MELIVLLEMGVDVDLVVEEMSQHLGFGVVERVILVFRVDFLDAFFFFIF